MTARIVSFPNKSNRPAQRKRHANGTHLVFVRRWSRRDNVSWTVEETREGSDWWGFIADAKSFDEAIRIAIARMEQGGEVELLLEEQDEA